MPNIIANQPNVIIPRADILASDVFSEGDIVIAYEIGAVNKSWVPGRLLNGFDTFRRDVGYYIIGGPVDIDLQYTFAPPITVNPPGSFRFATENDITQYPQMTTGDYIIDAPNVGDGGVIEYVPEMQPGKKIFIKGGTYKYLYINVTNGSGTPQEPIIITNYDGQVVGRFDLVGGNFKLTGKYDPVEGTGDPNYLGWDGAINGGCLSGKFGFYLSAGFSDEFTHAIQVNEVYTGTPNISNIEIEYVECGNGGYTGMSIKTTNGNQDMNNIHIHDCYIHDTHGEGVYIGSTEAVTTQQLNNLSFHDNLICRTGLNGMQFGQLQDNVEVYNNTIICTSMKWSAAFQQYQDQATQFQTVKGGLNVYNNLVIGGGENFINFFMRPTPGVSQDSSQIRFENNAFLHNRHSYVGYLNIQDIPQAHIIFNNNVFGKHSGTYTDIYPNAFSTDFELLTETYNVSSITVEATNNITDNTNTKGATFIKKQGETANVSTVESNNTVTTLPDPEFVNFMDFTSSFDYTTLEYWTPTINVGPNDGDPRAYAEDDYVTYRGKLYRSLHDNNSGNTPNVTDSHWELITFANSTTTCVPDDGRLVAGNYYTLRGIGLTRNSGQATTTTSTSTSSTTSTSTTSTSSSTTTTTTQAPTFNSDDKILGAVDNGNNTFTLKWGVNEAEFTDTKFRIVGLGSSTLYGTGATAGNSLAAKIQTWLTANTTGGQFINMAVGGTSTPSALPDGTGGENPIVNVSAALTSKANCAFVAYPSNDISAGLTPQQYVNNLQIIFNTFRNAGIPCFVETPQPRSAFNATQQTALATASALVLSTFPNEYVIDVFNALRDTGAGTDAVINPSYSSGDGIHVNDAGHDIIYQEFISKVGTYFQDSSYTEHIVERSEDGVNFYVFDILSTGSSISKTYPRLDSLNHYYRVRSRKSDNSLTNYSNSVSVYQPVVAGSSDQVIKVNFSQSSDTNPPVDWNDFLGSGSGDTVVNTTFINLEDENDIATTVSLLVTKKFGAVISGTGGTGGVYPNTVSSSGWTSRLSFNDYSQLRISNLSPNAVYKLEVLTSYGNVNGPALGVRDNLNRNKAGFEFSANWPTDGNGNINNLITLNGLVSDVSGNLYIDFLPFTYNAGVVCGMVLTRYSDGTPTTTSTSTTSTSSTSTTSTSSTSTTTNSTTSTSTTTSSSTTTTTTTLYSAGEIFVNIYGGTNPYNNVAWNDWNIGNSSTPLGFTNLKFTNGASSNYNISWSAYVPSGVSDNGSSYVGSSDWPQQVLRYAAFTYNTGVTAPNTNEFIISSLNDSYTYDFEFIGSRSNTGNTSVYSAIGTTTVTSSNLVTASNSSNSVTCIGVRPLSGQIRIRFANASGVGSSVGYLNAFKIVVTSGTPTTTTSTSSTSTTSTSSTSSTSTTSTSSTSTTSTSSSTTTTTTVAAGTQFQTSVPYTSGGTTTQALLYLPNDYNTSGINYPLLVCLHGAGESGTNITALYNNGMPAGLINNGTWPHGGFVNPANGQTYKFIVLSPQRNNSWSSSGNEVEEYVKHMVANYRIDTSRVYVTGLSAGGAGVVEYACHLNPTQTNTTQTRTYPAAAVVPMSPAINAPQASWGTAAAVDSVKVWSFGSLTDIHGVRGSEFATVINNAASGNARFTQYTGGHCCWSQFYNPNYTENIGGTDMNIYEWMLQYT